MPEKNIVVKTANMWGRAVGTFQRARFAARHGSATRDQVVSGIVESGKYRTTDYSSLAAQKRALQSSWVYIALSRLTSEFAASIFEVVRHSGQPEDADVPIKNHPLERLVNVRPNPYMGSAFFKSYLAWWLGLNGNCYIYVGVNTAGQVEELWPLPAGEVEPMPGDEERFIDHYLYHAQGHEYQIPAEYVVHVRLPNPFDIFRGLSPLSAAMNAVDTDGGMSRWNSTFFTHDNVMPSAVINLSSGNPEKPLSPADASSLKEDLKADYQAHRRKTAVTTAYKLEVEQLGWNPKDLDFIEGRNFTKEEIFNVYGVPVALLSADATYSNSENAYKVLKDNMWPWLVLMAEQMTVELVQPFYGMDQAGRFQDIRIGNREQELAEVDSATEYLTVDEIRADYWRKDPLPNGRGGFTGRETTALESILGRIADSDNGDVIEGESELLIPDRPKLRQPRQPKQLTAGNEEKDKEKDEEELLKEGEAKEDLKRWKKKSLRHLRANQALPIYFRSRVISEVTLRRVRLQLLRLQNIRPDDIAEEIRSLFDTEANLLYPFV